MTKLPRTLRLDPSDLVVFDRAADPGEWAVPGGFAFWDEDPATLAGKRRQAFRAGFLGLGSFGWSTLVEVAEATPAEREAATAALAAHIRAAHGAPDDAAAWAAAAEEIGFAVSLCDHPAGTVLALARTVEDGPPGQPMGQRVRERFRTLHRRAQPHRDFGALPVFAVIDVEGEEPVERPDLTASDLIAANLIAPDPAARGFVAPGFKAPGVTVPSFAPPVVTAPSFTPPVVTPRVVTATVVTVPADTVPADTAPGVTAPGVTIPADTDPDRTTLAPHHPGLAEGKA